MRVMGDVHLHTIVNLTFGLHRLTNYITGGGDAKGETEAQSRRPVHVLR